jgi:uncharacterized membrane protein HdeD (DUF308 family)
MLEIKGTQVMSPTKLTVTADEAVVVRSIHRHWRVFMAEGIVLIVLGLGAIVVPPIAGLATTVVLGWLFVAAGVAGLVSTFGAPRSPGFIWSLLSALAAMIAGVALLMNPLQGLVVLTYVLGAFFFCDGVLTIALAISHRRELSGRWEWMMVNGALDLILAGVIISGVAGAVVWMLGLIVGIDMIFGGVALVTMALEARRPTAPQ